MTTVHAKRYRMSPYLFSLSCVFWGLILFTWCLLVKFCVDGTRGMALAETAQTGIFQGVLLISALMLVLIVVFLRNGYEYFGTIEICADRVVFRTLLQKPRIFYYSDIKEIGIDYGTLQFDQKQFWIYFTKDPMDRKYTHNILRLPFSSESMRVQYSRELFDALLVAIPDGYIRKQLSRSHSVIQLHRVKE